MSRPVECEPHEVCEAHRFPASSSGLAPCRRPGSSVTVPEGPGGRQSPARRLQPEPTGASNPASRASDWGRAAARRWLGYVPTALQEFQERRRAGLLARAGRRQGGGGGAGAGPGAGVGGWSRALLRRAWRAAITAGPRESRPAIDPAGPRIFGGGSSAGVHAWHHGPDASFRQAQSERGRGLGVRGSASGSLSGWRA